MLTKQRHVFVYNKTKETFLAFRVKVADSIFGRLVGLLGRRSLQPDSGVWIVPANAVHTIGMMFSFDLVLIDKDFRVVGLRELVRPFTITMPHRKAESVIELPAHTIFRSRTQIGDQLVIERYEAKKTPAADSAPAQEAPEVRSQEVQAPAMRSAKPQFPVGPIHSSSSGTSLPPQSAKPEAARQKFAVTRTH
jgi:uncharacterized membrane protein (UPF0127 family)